MAARTTQDGARPQEALTATDVVCPSCGQGTLVPARGRFGPVYKCNAETKPKCKFQLNSRPTGATCQYPRENGRACGALMVEGTKTIPDRCSDRDCPNRNPHKLPAAAE